MEFFLNVFHWIQQIQWQKIYDIKRTRTCHPATSCVRDQNASTVPARHMWEIGSLNWAEFMLQWFINFSEFTEFSESSAPFRKNSNNHFSSLCALRDAKLKQCMRQCTGGKAHKSKLCALFLLTILSCLLSICTKISYLHSSKIRFQSNLQK